MSLDGRNGGTWIQLLSATEFDFIKHTSIGVRNPRHFLGRLFNLPITKTISCSVRCTKLDFFGKILSYKPICVLVRSTLPGSIRVSKVQRAFVSFAIRSCSTNSSPLSAVIVKDRTGTDFSKSITALATAGAVLRSTFFSKVRRDTRSTRETMACLCPFPMIVSAYRSPSLLIALVFRQWLAAAQY